MAGRKRARRKHGSTEVAKNVPATWVDGAQIHRSHVSASRYCRRSRFDDLIADQVDRIARRLGFKPIVTDEGD